MKKNKRYHSFDDAITRIFSGCQAVYSNIEVGSGMENYPRYAELDIKIHLYPTGSGYIHIMDQDSETVDFLSLDPNPPKILTSSEEANNKKLELRIQRTEQKLSTLKARIVKPHPVNLNED